MRTKTNRYMREKNEYENAMERQGFRKHKKRGAWIKGGLGMFLTNTSDFDENDNYLDIMKTDQFYQGYLEMGCELVLGPAVATTADGKTHGRHAVYLKNYQEYFEKLEEIYQERHKNDTLPKSISEERKQETASTPEEVNNDSEENEIDKITAQFQRIANNYEMARKHSMFGFNMEGIIDTAINNLYSLEKEVAEKYQGKELYDIICSLQDNLTGIESCKTHIIYALETSLFDQIAKDKQIAPSDKINSDIAYGCTTLKERDSNGISDFVERVNSYPIEERCAIITGIAKQYADKKLELPGEAVTMFHNIREGIFQETFSDQSTKNIVKQ